MCGTCAYGLCVYNDRVLIKRAAVYVYILIANIKFFVLCLCLAPLFSCKIFDHKKSEVGCLLEVLWYKVLASSLKSFLIS